MKIKFFLVLITYAFLLFSCNQKIEKKAVITNFENVFLDSLQPSEEMKKSGYSMFNAEIKGYVNDSIKVNLENGEDDTTFYLKGEIDNDWLYEYSGCCTRFIRIDPYKANAGRIEIKYRLY